MEKKVRIFTTTTCMYCRTAKEFFNENNVAYEEYDVAVDAEKRQEMFTKSGQKSVPVIFVNDDMVIGFDRERLAELLGVK